MIASTSAVTDRVRDAAERRAPLRLRGRGTWMAANRPVHGAEELPLDGLSGIVEYVPGDFTITVRAGTTLGEISAATNEHRQWLPLDPPGGAPGSIGATVATASCGPLASAFGTPRDHLLGVEFVTGTGDTVRGGGRVVKNVAGFDLVRLSTGAWGTLGVITELSLRLRSRPPADETYACGVGDDAEALAWVCTALRALTAAPLAAELVNATLARTIGLDGGSSLLVRIGGNAESMRAQREALARVGSFAPTDPGVWNRLSAPRADDAAVWRLSQRPSAFADTWTSAREALAAAPHGWMHGSLLRGVVRCGVPGAPADVAGAVARALMHPFDGTRIGELLPEHAWSLLPSPAMDRLSRGIRSAFDPTHILNPGILGEGA